MTRTEPKARSRVRSARTPRADVVLGRYRLEERLASGGTAEVWRARDTRVDRTVAVKLLHPHLLPDATSRTRFESEVRAVAGLSHPGIVKVLGVQGGSRPAIVLDFVEGETLAARIERDGPMAPREAARVGAEIGEALYHAHARGVIHRDVKPANILLNGGDRARLVDFGIARLLGEAQERTTQAGTVVGTPRYMAPEQLRDGEVGPRADLYGLGAVLCEALTGRPPYTAATPVALLEAQASGPPPMPGVDPALRAVARACLQADPADRPLHAGAVAAALRAWMTGDPQPALAISPAASSQETIVAPVAQPTARPPAKLAPLVAADVAAADVAAASVPSEVAPGTTRHARWRPTLLAMAAIAVLLVVALVAGGQFRLPLSGAADVPSAVPGPTTTPVPAWVGALIDQYQAACGTADVPTTANLLAMGQEEATQFVQDKVDACQKPKGKGKGHGG